MAALVVFPFMAIRFGGIPNRCLSVTRHRRANLLVMWPQATGRATPNNPGTAPTLPPVDTHRLHRCKSAQKADGKMGAKVDFAGERKEGERSSIPVGLLRKTARAGREGELLDGVRVR